jgi:hypothetical protein
MYVHDIKRGFVASRTFQTIEDILVDSLLVCEFLGFRMLESWIDEENRFGGGN